MSHILYRYLIYKEPGSYNPAYTYNLVSDNEQKK